MLKHNQCSMSNHTRPSHDAEIQLQIGNLVRRVDYLASKIKSNAEVPKKDWYRPSEACKLLGISRAKFEAYKRSGLFPTHKVGGCVYVASADISGFFSRMMR